MASATTATTEPEAWLVQQFELEMTGAESVRFEPSTGDVEVSVAGTGLARHNVAKPAAAESYGLPQAFDVADLNHLALGEILDVEVGPTADPTDDPSATHLYVLAAPSATGTPALFEIALNLPLAATAPTVVGTLVNDVATSAWTPPSPDPSGIVLLNSGELLVSDSEVNEIVALFTGDNLFRISTDGSLLGTATTAGSVSNEPTGLGYNPSNQHLFVSDDDFVRVREIDPGTDGLHGTIDDVVSVIDVAAVGVGDPEGIEYDPATGDLFILDGIGNEIYRLSAGTDGVFATADDTVSSFDTAVLGTGDPEGLGLDTDRGVLLITDRVTDSIFEVSKDGVLLRIIDVKSINGGFGPSFMSAITRAPGSTAPGTNSLYVLDRAEDNNIDPNENDGRLYEFSYPVGAAVPTVTIETTDSNASEDGPDTATFTVVRTGGDFAASVTVNYSVGGSATSGIDFGVLAGSVTLAADVTTATITVVPIHNPLAEAAETVTLTLTADAAYELGAPSQGTATIADSTFIENRFVDDNDSIFENDIDKLAAIGVTRGCNPPTNDRFCPDDPVTRGQMAAFLVRTFGYTDDGGGDLFTDDNNSVFEADIDKLGTAGVTRGCNPPANDNYCPDNPVTRGQMAAFLIRALGL